MEEKKDLAVLKLVFIIVDWKVNGVVSAVFDRVNVRFQFVAKGLGTARSDLEHIIGLGTPEKAVVLCLEQDVLVPHILREIGKKLDFNMPGTGIGFSVPLSGVNAPILKVFKKSIEKSVGLLEAAPGGAGRENPARAAARARESLSGGEKMAEENQENQKGGLIIAILNQGNSEDFMSCAREAGAGGGTVIKGRGLMHKGPIKFFGISVQNEKEIILVLSSPAKMKGIMEAVSKAFGITSKAEGIIFSLPAEDITGINLR